MVDKKITYTVGCKINIFLHIGKKRPDGYHDIESLLYPVSNPHDTLSIVEHTKKRDFVVHCENEALSKDNILYAVYSEILSYCKKNKKKMNMYHEVFLVKGIPIGAGLGGGSADAGVFLRYFNERFGEDFFPKKVLHSIASNIGADIPFFLYNIPMVATGYGDILREVTPDFKGMYCLILEFSHSTNTAKAYKDLENFREKSKKFLTSDDKYSRKYSGLTIKGNDFEQMLFEMYPTVRDCKMLLLQNGAVVASISGSGSSMFGIFRKEKEISDTASAVQNMVKAMYSSVL